MYKQKLKSAFNNQKCALKNLKSASFLFIVLCPFLNMGEALIIEDISDRAEVWKKLKKYFRPVSRARVMNGFETQLFISCIIKPEECIRIYVSRLKRIIEQLNKFSHPIEELCFQLLRFFPAKYENIVQSIYRQDENNFKFPKILKQILIEESYIKKRI